MRHLMELLAHNSNDPLCRESVFVHSVLPVRAKLKLKAVSAVNSCISIWTDLNNAVFTTIMIVSEWL